MAHQHQEHWQRPSSTVLHALLALSTVIVVCASPNAVYGTKQHLTTISAENKVDCAKDILPCQCSCCEVSDGSSSCSHVVVVQVHSEKSALCHPRAMKPPTKLLLQDLQDSAKDDSCTSNDGLLVQVCFLSLFFHFQSANFGLELMNLHLPVFLRWAGIGVAFGGEQKGSLERQVSHTGRPCCQC
jgi:hypothetical protein